MAQFGGLFSQLQRSTYWTRVWSLRCFSEKNKVVRETKRVTIANGLFAILVKVKPKCSSTSHTHTDKKTPHFQFPLVPQDCYANYYKRQHGTSEFTTIDQTSAIFYLVPRVKREGTIAMGSKSHLYSVTSHCVFIIGIILVSAGCGTHSPGVIWAE